MEYGVHLPLVDLGDGFSLSALRDCARAAAELGYTWLCANDHLVFSRPWLDGLTALSAVVDVSGGATLATTIGNPVIRGPAPLAKALTALDVLSCGRVVAGVGPGSSAADYALAGVPFEERWRRFDQALPAFRGQLGGVPVWVASWGSPVGLRRAARLGDGWLASAYNVTPDRMRECVAALASLRAGRVLPNALATAWTYVSEDRADAERVLTDVLSPMLNRPPESLRHLPVGSAEVCAQRLGEFAAAGTDRVLLWPLADPVRQLEAVRERVIPAVPAQPRSSPG